MNEFDYIIIGAGAAGLNLAHQISKDPFFDQKKIAIIEPTQKNTNDKTWSYWQEGDDDLDHLVYQKWNEGKFYSKNLDCNLNLNSYQYKSIRSIDFYQWMQSHLRSCANITWIQDEVVSINSKKKSEIIGKKGVYESKFSFDSRIELPTDHKKFTCLNQHFLGWIVEFKNEILDPKSFVMMDFRHPYKEQTSFMYVLPSSAKRALFESTFFDHTIQSNEIYENEIKSYLDRYFPGEEYSLLEREQGVIPMSMIPFHHMSNESNMKIGTAGSWVKPSTGYSFHRSRQYARKIVQNLKDGTHPNKGILNKKHRFFDAVLMDILDRKNHLGPEIFESMYKRNYAHQIFKFLDEETTLWEELKIILSFRPWEFIRSAFRVAFKPIF